MPISRLLHFIPIWIVYVDIHWTASVGKKNTKHSKRYEWPTILKRPWQYHKIVRQWNTKARTLFESLSCKTTHCLSNFELIIIGTLETICLYEFFKQDLKIGDIRELMWSKQPYNYIYLSILVVWWRFMNDDEDDNTTTM